MARLLVHVEGQTEEEFVTNVLRPHLYNVGFEKVDPRLLGNARQRDRRGGIRSWPSQRREIIDHLKYDRNCFATTMVDYYGLPKDEPKAWPGRAAAAIVPFPQKASTVQNAILADICSELGTAFDPNRFIPYVMMHEFEGLLFRDCQAFGRGIGRPDLIPEFQAIRDEFQSPEEINDRPEHAPSKRVESLVTGYQKPFLGTLAILEIGLDSIRRECAFFRQWLDRLERLQNALP